MEGGHRADLNEYDNVVAQTSLQCLGLWLLLLIAVHDDSCKMYVCMYVCVVGDCNNSMLNKCLYAFISVLHSLYYIMHPAMPCMHVQRHAKGYKGEDTHAREILNKRNRALFYETCFDETCTNTLPL